MSEAQHSSVWNTGMVKLTRTKAWRATLLCVIACATNVAAGQTVTDLSGALDELGVRMLRPHAEIEVNRPYSLIVMKPNRLIPIGVDDVGPGDRVIARLLEGNRLLLYTSYGDESAPIELHANGEIKQVETVPDLEGNKHYSAQSRDRRIPPKPGDDYGKGSRGAPIGKVLGR